MKNIFKKYWAESNCLRPVNFAFCLQASAIFSAYRSTFALLFCTAPLGYRFCYAAVDINSCVLTFGGIFFRIFERKRNKKRRAYGQHRFYHALGENKMRAVRVNRRFNLTFMRLFGKALCELLSGFDFIEDHSLTEGMGKFVPVYKFLGKIPAVRSISNKITVLKRN